MKSKSRRQENTDATREALVKSALKLFAENGYAATSVDVIAEGARVTKGAVYHHFKTKKEIYIACYHLQASRASDAIAEAEVDDDLWQFALNQCLAFFAFVIMQRKSALPLQEVITVIGWSEWRMLDSTYTMGYIIQTIEALKSKGLIKSYSTEALTDMIYGLLVNAAMSLSSQTKSKSSLDKQELYKQLSFIIEKMLFSLKA